MLIRWHEFRAGVECPEVALLPSFAKGATQDSMWEDKQLSGECQRHYCFYSNLSCYSPAAAAAEAHQGGREPEPSHPLLEQPLSGQVAEHAGCSWENHPDLPRILRLLSTELIQPLPSLQASSMPSSPTLSTFFKVELDLMRTQVTDWAQPQGTHPSTCPLWLQGPSALPGKVQ